ncbi:MAG: DrmE family protein, partial [Lachnospiraceae bacterium]|nr:DrmE family protein [Lachnospiraceae bacterium]
FDFKTVIKNIEIVSRKMNSYPKTEAIYQFLIDRRIDSFYLICANNDLVQAVKEYWIERLAKRNYRPNIMVMYAKDFLKLDKYTSDIAIISGWLSASVLRKIIYGYLVEEIHIYTYECEERWKRAHTRSWKIGLNNQNNKVIAEKSFANQTIRVHENAKMLEMTEVEQSVLHEKDDFDLIMQENRYRQYMSRSGQTQESIVNAKPVGFVGGEFALYTSGHKILVASNIITQTGDKIEEKEIGELVIGDFVVVRESSKDIIREVADNILEANNKLSLRKIAALWKEALQIEFAFSSIEDIYNALCALGCTRNMQTVRNWILSEDIIIPRDKEDLTFIAQMTKDAVLLEKKDEVFNAGIFIKNAHIKAGRILSERLTEGIAKKLFSGERIDPYNIWDSIELNLEDVGYVKILKVIDLGQEWIPVNVNDTNKILAEEKENVLWQE